MYTGFADVYDKLMCDVDYKKWADYIETIFRKKRVRPSLVLDLGCGTGSLCVELAKRGYEMIGIDISAEMLSCAKQKAVQAGLDILFIQQDMCDFELYGTVDAVICMLDSVNYITGKNDVKRMFKWVRNYMNPDGIFIFDINSRYKFEKILRDQIFYEIDEDITYIWKNSYDQKKKICEFDLTFFVRQDEQYAKFEEVHYERAYSADEIRDMLSVSGLRLLNVFGELNFRGPASNSKRIFFICKK